ncbi:unnamed protein product [Pseudo-nitzschia multistriata]|uniref:Uncharacterized protein n=1 Tax=Pseudo-nitzschia multistriata TaxID=183589 RepID=A0A448ZI29_9STRA|nr:unnamed protein product [Pseudo-nitzschia multistriata]
MARLPTTKLAVLALLGFCALVIGSIVLTFQLLVIEEKKQRGLLGQQKILKSNVKNTHSPTSRSAEAAGPSPTDFEKRLKTSKYTVKQSLPTGAFDIRLWNIFPAPEGGNYKTIGEAYWRQVQAFLRNWKDAAVYPPDPSDYLTYSTDWMVRKSSEYRGTHFGSQNKTSGNDAYHFYPRLALERAAEAGHPMAQHYLANAHSSGIWPVPATGGGEKYDSSRQESPFASLVKDLHVFDEWLPTSGEHIRQIDKAYLLWHMAAVGGNIESAMALAYRLDETVSMTDPSTSNGDTCEESLPYYQAAADGIIDQLEVSLHSRAKVIPPMDKHTLAQVHMHGGTSSQLDWNNKPDESEEALQFYHLKATTVPWSINKKSSSEDEKKDEKSKVKKKSAADVQEEEGIDILAAFTLAHFYHHGMRGVEQNLTKSVQYYEIAAKHGHWESAGHACIFHLWGIGVEQNAYRAMKFCKIGAPFGYDGCLQMNKRSKDAKNRGITDPDITTCDENALNGMGLLNLLGIQNVLQVDLPLAEKYFTLAKETGSVDAYYNLAMMWLGWKTHFKTANELKEDGFTSDQLSAKTALPIEGQTKESSEKFVLYKAEVGDNMFYKGPIQSDVQKALKLLEAAAKLGHVQSKHRLGSIYAKGLNHTTSLIQFNFVKKDCKLAKQHFKWIVKNASSSLSNRLRTAYKEYVAGNFEVSVRNYLAAAEVGSISGQVNAAFLMERGVCLGLDAADCAKAAVRLWKVAAARGNAEACLRVGDFYYYGRLHGERLHNGPFGWIQYYLFPEKYLPILLKERIAEVLNIAQNYVVGKGEYNRALKSSTSSSGTTCGANGEGSCPNDNKSNEGTDSFSKKDFSHEMEEDLHTAAHYYQIAGEKHQSARANFNLGFMHQWGLGLKQDFPMAKRHYDLALSKNLREAEIAVQIALMAMNAHEFVIRCKVFIEDWWYQRDTVNTKSDSTSNMKSATTPSDSAPDALKPTRGVGHAPGSSPNKKKTREEIIAAHIFNRSSLIIVILFLLLLLIQLLMSFVGRPQR